MKSSSRIRTLATICLMGVPFAHGCAIDAGEENIETTSSAISTSTPLDSDIIPIACNGTRWDVKYKPKPGASYFEDPKCVPFDPSKGERCPDSTTATRMRNSIACDARAKGDGCGTGYNTASSGHLCKSCDSGQTGCRPTMYFQSVGTNGSTDFLSPDGTWSLEPIGGNCCLRASPVDANQSISVSIVCGTCVTCDAGPSDAGTDAHDAGDAESGVDASSGGG